MCPGVVKLLLACSLVAAPAVAVGGCDRSAPPADSADPRAVVQRFAVARAARNYKALESLVVSDQALHVSAFVERVDRFVDANRRLCDVTRDRVAVGLAESVDQSYITAALGLFGLRIEVLDERVSGDDANVTYTVAGRLPPESVALRRASAGWRIDPGPGFSPLMTEAFAAMADGLTRLATRIESGELSAADLLKNPEQLPREVESGMRRGMELLSRARSQSTGPRP